MKMSIDKRYVESYQMDRVKADAKQFKEAFTNGDLMRSFREQTNDYRTYTAEIICCKASAMDSGWACGNETMFCIEAMLENTKAIYKLRFYINMNLEIDLREGLVTVREFRETD